MNNVLTPKAYKIIDVRKESNLEYTFKVETDIKVEHGQFLQLSIPKVGEAPISVSGFGDGYLEFTIRSVGKVTDKIFTSNNFFNCLVYFVYSCCNRNMFWTSICTSSTTYAHVIISKLFFIVMYFM